MLKKIYTHLPPFIVLFSPLFVLSASIDELLNTRYLYFLLFFHCFFFGALLLGATKRPGTPTTERSQSLFGSFNLTLASLGMLYASIVLIDQPFAFGGIICALTLFAISNAAKNCSYVFMYIGSVLLGFAAVVFTGFLSLEFKHLVPALYYSIAMACLATAHYCAPYICSLLPDPAAIEPGEKTRNQRRKFKKLHHQFSGTRSFRLSLAIMLLLGPIIIVTMAATPLLAPRFLLLAFIFPTVRPILSAILPDLHGSGVASDTGAQITSFCLLAYATVLLIRLFPV